MSETMPEIRSKLTPDLLDTQFDTILVANRGEIALRVFKTASQLGFKTVAVYSDADQGAPHCLAADCALRLGEAAPFASYLNIEAILACARQSGAQAVHPGYGFLAENAAFAQACLDAGLVFIGPPPAAMTAMGNKAGAKAIMIAAGVPCVPGYQGEDQSDASFLAAARDIGFPIMIKAAAGGGGRGMRRVDNIEALAASLPSARSEALNAFASGELILEKAIIEPRHIEIQVFADSQGNVLHLGERDCSVQRRHQKVVEEAPSPAVTPELRARMGAVAVAATRAIGYVGAGTLEFLLDQNGAFYFMEMNTRLQVEHAVTEAVLGLDLVAWQLRVAQGAALPMTQAEVDARFVSGGHAIEVRLCAEDPAQDFLPQSGPVVYWQAAPHVRCEHALYSGAAVSPHYDSMIAKIIAHGPTRADAVRQLTRALGETHLLGIPTNRYFLAQCLSHPEFRAGRATTAFIEQQLPASARMRPAADITAQHLACALLARQSLALQVRRFPAELTGWASSARYPQTLRFELDGVALQMQVLQTGANSGEIVAQGPNTQSTQNTGFAISPMAGAELAITLGGIAHKVLATDGYFVHGGREYSLRNTSAMPATRAAQGAGDGRIKAPMNGKVVSLEVATGAQVVAGQTLLVLEAMKMEHRIAAACDGVVAELMVELGAQVGPGQVLMVVEAAVTAVVTAVVTAEK